MIFYIFFFQRAEIAFTLFHIDDDFRFEFLSDDGRDILHYRVSYRDDFAITVTCVGVDSRDCGPCSNLVPLYEPDIRDADRRYRGFVQ
jgi:hypothetical protein